MLNVLNRKDDSVTTDLAVGNVTRIEQAVAALLGLGVARRCRFIRQRCCVRHEMGTMVYAFLMNTSVAAFKSLPLSERIQLVEDIWDSIAEETPEGTLQLSEHERVELQARFAAHQSDPRSSIPWSEVRAALFKGKH